MRIGEFDIIRSFFSCLGRASSSVLLGVGDDCALIRPSGDHLAVSVDTLVEGVHFPREMSPEDIGHRALAVSLSDLAAMAADPSWFTLALTLPESEPDWLKRFAAGMESLAVEAGVALVGGDTTRGPLTVTIQVAGYVPPEQAVLRRGACPGDRIVVSGELGSASAGLALLEGVPSGTLRPEEVDALVHCFCRPRPRLDLVKVIRACATAAIDISDGLLADLGHILQASGVGAVLDLDAIPCALATRTFWKDRALEKAVSFGDDYEICMCVPSEVWATRKRDELSSWFEIGRITDGEGIRFEGQSAKSFSLPQAGYRHF